MSIIQEALKKAQDEYVEKNIPISIKEEIIKPKIEVRILHNIKKTISVRVSVLAGILTILLMIYGLSVSEQYFKNHEKDIKTTPVSAPAAKGADPISPAKTGVINSTIQLPPVFVLNGIMYVENKPQAIINGYVLEEGDKINGATVLIIEKDCVLLDVNDANIRLELNK